MTGALRYSGIFLHCGIGQGAPCPYCFCRYSRRSSTSRGLVGLVFLFDLAVDWTHEPFRPYRGTIKLVVFALYLGCGGGENIYCFSFCEVDFFF